MDPNEGYNIRLHKFGLSSWQFTGWSIVIFGAFAFAGVAMEGGKGIWAYLVTGLPPAIAMAGLIVDRARKVRNQSSKLSRKN